MILLQHFDIKMALRVILVAVKVGSSRIPQNGQREEAGKPSEPLITRRRETVWVGVAFRHCEQLPSIPTHLYRFLPLFQRSPSLSLRNQHLPLSHRQKGKSSSDLTSKNHKERGFSVVFQCLVSVLS